MRVRDGKRLVTDGPFAETREQLGGYFLIDAKNLDEAIGIAGRIPAGALGHGGNPAGDRGPEFARRFNVASCRFRAAPFDIKRFKRGEKPCDL